MDLYDEISFKTSKLVTKKYSTSFSIAVGFLSNEMRQAIYSIYGFVRFADEIVDTFHDVDQEQVLNKFEADYYDSISSGISMNPILHSFAITVKKYNIPAQFIDSFLSSMRVDLKKQVYVNENELNQYIYGSADVVGLMCLMVFVGGDEKAFNNLKGPAMKLGSAFQKVNFLRDLKDDVEQLDRQYFPQFDINTFNEKVKLDLIADIENDFKEAREGMVKLPGKSKLAVYIAYVYYKKLLLNIKRTPAKKIMNQRIRVPNPTKIILLGNAYIRYQLNII